MVHLRISAESKISNFLTAAPANAITVIVGVASPQLTHKTRLEKCDHPTRSHVSGTKYEPILPRPIESDASHGMSHDLCAPLQSERNHIITEPKVVVVLVGNSRCWSRVRHNRPHRVLGKHRTQRMPRKQ